MYDDIPALIDRMVADLDRLPAGDARRHFHNTYLRTTRAVAEEIDRGGSLTAPGWSGGTSPSPTSTSTCSQQTSRASRYRGRGGSPSTPPGTDPSCRRCGTSCSA